LTYTRGHYLFEFFIRFISAIPEYFKVSSEIQDYFKLKSEILESAQNKKKELYELINKLDQNTDKDKITEIKEVINILNKNIHNFKEGIPLNKKGSDLTFTEIKLLFAFYAPRAPIPERLKDFLQNKAKELNNATA
jgi:hypothetical protein